MDVIIGYAVCALLLFVPLIAEKIEATRKPSVAVNSVWKAQWGDPSYVFVVDRYHPDTGTVAVTVVSKRSDTDEVIGHAAAMPVQQLLAGYAQVK